MQYVDDKYYHLYNRGAHKQTIFFMEENYAYCIDLLKKNKNKYRVSLLCYCLMPNHYHLIVRQENGGSISGFVQSIFNTYSQAINKARNHSGTLFQGRVKGKVIDSDRYLLDVIKYIHLNPVTAALVNQPEDWEYSDFRAWIYSPRRNEPNIMLRNLFFRDGNEYEEFVKARIQEKELEQLNNYLFNEA